MELDRPGLLVTYRLRLAFLIFGVKVGLRMSLLVYVVSLLVWLVHFVALFSAGETPMGGAVFYQLFASDGLLLVMPYGRGGSLCCRLSKRRSSRELPIPTP